MCLVNRPVPNGYPFVNSIFCTGTFFSFLILVQTGVYAGGAAMELTFTIVALRTFAVAEKL